MEWPIQILCKSAKPMWMWWSNRPSLNTNIDHHQHKTVCTNIFATLRHYCHKFYRIWQHHFELTIQPLVSVFNVSAFFSIKITREQMVQQCWEKNGVHISEEHFMIKINFTHSFDFLCMQMVFIPPLQSINWGYFKKQSTELYNIKRMAPFCDSFCQI